MAPRPSLPPNLKKRKAETASNAADIRELEAQLTDAVTSQSSLNPLADLLEIARNAAEVVLLSNAIYALHRVFVVIISNGLLQSKASNEETLAVRTWLQERLQSYVAILSGLLQDDDDTIRVCGRILWMLKLQES